MTGLILQAAQWMIKEEEEEARRTEVAKAECKILLEQFSIKHGAIV